MTAKRPFVRCHYPHPTKPRAASRRWFPFCSERCAAEEAQEMTQAKLYCQTCDRWDEFDYEVHEHELAYQDSSGRIRFVGSNR